MVRFEYVDEITSDVMFRAYGEDLGEVMVNAALAMFGVMYDLEKIPLEEEVKIEISGSSEEWLLYEWLSNLLLEFEVEGIFFSQFAVEDIKREGEGLRATGIARGSSTHTPPIQTQVKGITLHRFSLKRTDNRYVATVVVDI